MVTTKITLRFNFESLNLKKLRVVCLGADPFIGPLDAKPQDRDNLIQQSP